MYSVFFEGHNYYKRNHINVHDLPGEILHAYFEERTTKTLLHKSAICQRYKVTSWLSKSKPRVKTLAWFAEKRQRRNSRNTKQRSPTKNQEVDRHRVRPFPHNLASHWSGLSGRSRRLASSAVVQNASWLSRVPLRRDQKTQIKWKKSSDRRKVHAGVLKDLRGPHEGKKSRWQRFLCLRCEVVQDSLQFCTETFCLKKGKKKKKNIKLQQRGYRPSRLTCFHLWKKSLRLNIFPKKQNKRLFSSSSSSWASDDRLIFDNAALCCSGSSC